MSLDWHIFFPHLDLLLHDCFVDPANPRLFLIRTCYVEQECHGAHNIPNAQTLGAAMINLHDHVQMWCLAAGGLNPANNFSLIKTRRIQSVSFWFSSAAGNLWLRLGYGFLISTSSYFDHASLSLVWHAGGWVPASPLKQREDHACELFCFMHVAWWSQLDLSFSAAMHNFTSAWSRIVGVTKAWALLLLCILHLGFAAGLLDLFLLHYAFCICCI